MRFGGRSFLLILLILVGGFALFLAGVVVGASPASSALAPFLPSISSQENIPDRSIFTDVWSMVREDFIGQPVDERKLFYGSVKGAVESLNDPYSVFLDPDLAQSFEEELEGRFEGIGAEVGVKEKVIVIIAPLPGTPAANAGLLAGDAILMIDGDETQGWTVDEAVHRIRGKKGTEVVLTISRGTEIKEFRIQRDTITVPSLKRETKAENIELVTLSQFAADTHTLFRDEVPDLIVRQPQGMILDLRNNAGGYLDVAVDLVSHFVDDGPIVLEENSEGSRKPHSPTRRADLKDLKLAVLVNRGSASASEIVAGALQDYGRAVLIGETTFGKGTVQELRDFKDGSALKLSVARWLTPKGRIIDGKGIAPDIEVADAPADAPAEEDPQLQRAIEWILQPSTP